MIHKILPVLTVFTTILILPFSHCRYFFFASTTPQNSSNHLASRPHGYVKRSRDRIVAVILGVFCICTTRRVVSALNSNLVILRSCRLCCLVTIVKKRSRMSSRVIPGCYTVSVARNIPKSRLKSFFYKSKPENRAFRSVVQYILR